MDVPPPRRGSIERLRVFETGALSERIAKLVSESRYGMGMPELVARTGVLEADIQKALAGTALIAMQSPQFWILDATWIAAQLEVMHETLKRFHRENPLLPGLSKEHLRSKQLPAAPPWLLEVRLARARTPAE